jgi:hypothetical protein
MHDASLLKVQEQAADYVREAKRRAPSEPDELVSSVLDAVARDYFRHAVKKQRTRTRRTLPILFVLSAITLFAAPAIAHRLRWHLERDGRHQDRKLSADQQLSIGRDRWAGVRCRRPVRQRRTKWRGQGFAQGRLCQRTTERQCRFWKMEFGVGRNALQRPMDGDKAVIGGRWAIIRSPPLIQTIRTAPNRH